MGFIPARNLIHKFRSKCNPRLIKGQEKIPPFERMLSLEKRKALTMRKVMSRGRKRLRYLSHAFMTSGAQLKAFWSSKKVTPSVVQTKRMEATFNRAKHILNLRREGNRP